MGSADTEVQPLWRPLRDEIRAPIEVAEGGSEGGGSGDRRGYYGRGGGGNKYRDVNANRDRCGGVSGGVSGGVRLST